MKVIYPGSFDPITNGHVDIIVNTLQMFGEVTIVVMSNEEKKHKFSITQRVKLIEQSMSQICLRGWGNIIVEGYEGWISDYIKDANDKVVIVRGLRNNTDFDYEMMYEAFTRDFDAHTIYLSPNPKDIFTSSSLVRNLIDAGGDYLEYVPWKKLP